MSDTSPFHTETLQAPISGGDSTVHSLGNVVTMHAHDTPGIKGFCSIALVQDLVNVHLDVKTELLEMIFKEQGQQLASQFQSLISQVVTVVHQTSIVLGHQDTTRHVCHIKGLGSEVHVFDFNVRNNDRSDGFNGFLDMGPAVRHLLAVNLDPPTDPFERLLLRVNA